MTEQLPAGLTRLASGRIRWRVAVAGRRDSGTEDTVPLALIAREQAKANLGGAPRLMPTVGELLESHLRHAARAHTTIENWRWAIDHLPERFLARKAYEVTPAVVAALWRQLDAEGAPPHRLLKTCNVCSTAWQAALIVGFVESNPWKIVRAPAPPAADEIVPPTPELVAHVIGLAGDDPLSLWMQLASRTGARGGEICALRRTDLRLDSAEVWISRSIRRDGSTSPGKNGSKGHRVVPLDLATVFDLRMHAVDDPRCPWLFTLDGVNPARPDRIATKIRRLCVRNELEVLTPHDFRHFAVTQWLGDGVPVPTVAAMIGDNARTVMSTYAHWIPAQGVEAVDNLARRLDRLGTTRAHHVR